MKMAVELIIRTHSNRATASRKSRMVAVNLLAVTLLITALDRSIEEVYGQSCPPAVVGYIVRDERGNLLTEAQLESVSKEMEPAWGIRRMPFSDDGKTLLGGQAEQKEGRNRMLVLFVSSVARCEVKLSEITLKYGDRTMRLIFNTRVFGRSIAIDSLPFEEGTFELVLDKESQDKKEPYKGKSYVPADRWKKISDKP